MQAFPAPTLQKGQQLKPKPKAPPAWPLRWEGGQLKPAADVLLVAAAAQI
jgi:hypothetical protein